MVESFFQFSAPPFPAVPVAGRYFPAPGIEDARARLTRVIVRGQGAGLLIGPPGTGKSLLCEVIARQVRSELTVGQLLCGQLCSRRALLQAILRELGLPYHDRDEGTLRLALIDRLTAAGESPLLLLVDEAHTLPVRLLEEIRMMGNLARDGQSRVRLLLAGLPDLEERFAQPKLDAFNQRVAARCYLEALDKSDTKQFIRAQVTASGGDPDTLFADAACAAVYRATAGVPRLINQLCDHALSMARASQTRCIAEAGVEEAWADLQQLPLPSARPDTDQGSANESVVEFGCLEELEEEAEPIVPFGVERPDPQPTAAPADDWPEPDELWEPEPVVAEPVDDELEFRPAGSIGPAATPAIEPDLADPFAEPFPVEEIVVDRYAGRPIWPAQAPLPPAAVPPPALPPHGGRRNTPAVAAASGADAASEGPAAHGTGSTGAAGRSEPIYPEPVSADRPAATQGAEPGSPPTGNAVNGPNSHEFGYQNPSRRCPTAEQPAPAVALDFTFDAGSHDQIVIDDGPVDAEEPPTGSAGEPRYRLLFSKLRYG